MQGITSLTDRKDLAIDIRRVARKVWEGRNNLLLVLSRRDVLEGVGLEHQGFDAGRD